jgi:hypothetical protein
MARNPLVTDPTREHRVRERAYHLWEADGKPHGRDVEYWERAREQVGVEESVEDGKPVNAATSPVRPRRGDAVEMANGQEQPGKAAGGLTSRGEAAPAPAPAAKRRSRPGPKRTTT